MTYLPFANADDERENDRNIIYLDVNRKSR